MMDKNDKTDLESCIEEKAEEVEAMGTLTSECEFSHEEAEEFINDVRDIGTAGSTIGNYPIDVLNPVISSASEDGEKSLDSSSILEESDIKERSESIDKKSENYNVDTSIDSSYYAEDQSTIDFSTIVVVDDGSDTNKPLGEFTSSEFYITTYDDGLVVYHEYEVNDDNGEENESFKSFQERPSFIVTEEIEEKDEKNDSKEDNSGLVSSTRKLSINDSFDNNDNINIDNINFISCTNRDSPKLAGLDSESSSSARPKLSPLKEQNFNVNKIKENERDVDMKENEITTPLEHHQDPSSEHPGGLSEGD